jgi:hypothetical protein
MDSIKSAITKAVLATAVGAGFVIIGPPAFVAGALTGAFTSYSRHPESRAARPIADIADIAETVEEILACRERIKLISADQIELKNQLPRARRNNPDPRYSLMLRNAVRCLDARLKDENDALLELDKKIFRQSIA